MSHHFNEFIQIKKNHRYSTPFNKGTVLLAKQKMFTYPKTVFTLAERAAGHHQKYQTGHHDFNVALSTNKHVLLKQLALN